MLLDEDPATVSLFFRRLPNPSTDYRICAAHPPHYWQLQHPARQARPRPHQRIAIRPPASARSTDPGSRKRIEKYGSATRSQSPTSKSNDSSSAELSRNLNTLASHHSETVASHNAADHASQIVELDTQKFRIAKAASDLEIEGERLEQELEGLKARLQELETQGLEGDEVARERREVEDQTM